ARGLPLPAQPAAARRRLGRHGAFSGNPPSVRGRRLAASDCADPDLAPGHGGGALARCFPDDALAPPGGRAREDRVRYPDQGLAAARRSPAALAPRAATEPAQMSMGAALGLSACRRVAPRKSTCWRSSPTPSAGSVVSRSTTGTWPPPWRS